MMNTFSAFWQREPFVRLLLPWVVGIIIGLYIDVYIKPVWLLCIAGALVSSVTILIIATKQRNVIGVIQPVVLLVMGIAVTRLHDTGVYPQSVERITKHTGYVYGNVISDVDVKNGKERCTVQLTDYVSGQIHSEMVGNALLYLADYGTLKYGDGIMLPANNVQGIPVAVNPYEFNYKKYLYNRGIYAVIYAPAGEVTNTGQHHINYLKALAYRLNGYVVKQLRYYFKDSNIESLMEALLIGYRTQIDTTIVQAYTDCGVIHVLAVSGMQVGLVFVLLSGLTFFMKRYNHMRIIRLIIIVIGVWLFTAMAGLSGSVVRAAVMFTFIAMGRHMNRHVGIYNMLAASAFIILLFDPYAITDAGLQLSYAALWGIVFMGRRIYAAIPIQNPLLDKIWALTSVSIAAQLAATPLLLYYFHQFPLFFIPANLLAIPVTTFALYAGIGVVVLNFIPGAAHTLAWVTTVLMQLLNNYLELLQKHPIAKFYTSSWTVMETVFLAAVLLSAITFIIYKYKAAMWVCLSSLLIIAIWHSVNSIQYHQRSGITTLHMEHGRAVLAISGVNCVLVCDSTVLRNTYFMHTYFPNYIHSAGFKQWAVVHTEK